MRIRSVCGWAMCGMVAMLAGCTVGDSDGSEPVDEMANKASAPAVTATVPASDEERLTEPAPEVTFAWDVPNDGSVVQTSRTSIGLVVTNASKAPLTVRLVLRGDDGGTNIQQLPVGTLTLAAESRQPVTIDLARLRFDLPSLRFAGSVQLRAHIDGADGVRHESAVSDALYFHPTTDVTGASALAVYGSQALKTTFGKGDFRGTFRGLASDPEAAGLLRVVDFGGTLAAPASAPSAATTNAYKTCVSFQVDTIDSGIGIAYGPNAGGVEDYGAGWNDPTAITAYGVKVRLKKGTWEKEFIADPVTGCFSWSHEQKGPFEIRIYAYASNGKASVRTHDNPNDFSDTPGNNYFAMGNYSPTAGSTNGDPLTAWDDQGIFTMTGVVGFGLRRLTPHSVAGSRFDMALDAAKDGWSSAHWGTSNSAITKGHHYLKILNTQARRKFLVAHEFGHAFAAIDYGSRSGAKNGSEPGGDSGYGTFNEFQLCSEGPSYSIFTNEWSGIGFREGFAHFVASVIFNNKHSEGSFHWLGSHHDLERYGNGMGDQAGGRYENFCCFAADCPKTGTIEDWLLFFWDYYTNASDTCAAQPGVADMLSLYSETRLNGGLAKDNYFAKMQAAAKENANLPTCLKEGRFTSYASWNGIDN